jgi:hypothetical protein
MHVDEWRYSDVSARMSWHAWPHRSTTMAAIDERLLKAIRPFRREIFPVLVGVL